MDVQCTYNLSGTTLSRRDPRYGRYTYYDDNIVRVVRVYVILRSSAAETLRKEREGQKSFGRLQIQTSFRVRSPIFVHNIQYV